MRNHNVTNEARFARRVSAAPHNGCLGFPGRATRGLTRAVSREADTGAAVCCRRRTCPGVTLRTLSARAHNNSGTCPRKRKCPTSTSDRPGRTPQILRVCGPHRGGCAGWSRLAGRQREMPVTSEYVYCESEPAPYTALHRLAGGWYGADQDFQSGSFRPFAPLPLRGHGARKPLRVAARSPGYGWRGRSWPRQRPFECRRYS